MVCLSELILFRVQPMLSVLVLQKQCVCFAMVYAGHHIFSFLIYNINFLVHLYFNTPTVSLIQVCKLFISATKDD